MDYKKFTRHQYDTTQKAHGWQFWTGAILFAIIVFGGLTLVMCDNTESTSNTSDYEMCNPGSVCE